MRLSLHLRAVILAFFVTFLWSTSWILIKIGLTDIPALSFAGLRYCVASICLCPLMLTNKTRREELRRLSPDQWGRLIVLGIVFITITQGAQYVALDYLPAATVTLLLNFSTVLVAVFGIYLLRESPTPLQWAGIALFLVGVAVYFYPAALPANQWIGLVAVLVCMLANTGSSLLGRQINRDGKIHTSMVTFVSIGVGGILLLGAGLATNGLPHVSLINWVIIIWLAVVNTAFAFTLWNQALRILSAMESSIINNTMLVQIAVLAWVFLGETLGVQAILGMTLALCGALFAQFQRRENLKFWVRRSQPVGDLRGDGIE